MPEINNLSSLYNTSYKTLRALQKFISDHKEYFKHHVVTAFAFYKRDQADLWQAIRHFGGIKHFNKAYKLKLKAQHIGWTEQKLIRVLWKLHAQGHIISLKGLRAIGRTDILSIAKRLSSLGAIKIKMGLAKKRNKWTKEKVLKKYQALYKKWKKVPTHTELSKKGYGPLVQAIRKYYNTFKNIRNKLGITVSRKKSKYWSKRRTIIDLKDFCNANKSLIESTSVYGALQAQKNYSLMNAIRIHGGLKALNKHLKLGLVLHGEMWSERKVIQMLRQLHKNGIELTKSNITKFGSRALFGAMYRFGPLGYFREKLGVPASRYPCWTEEKVIEQLKPIINYYHFMPTGSILRAMDRSDLAKAISKCGGWLYFSNLLGIKLCTLLRAQDGHYLQSSYECIFDNILYRYKVPHRVHVQISKNSRHKCDFLIGNTYIEITGFERKGDNTYAKNLQTKIKLYNKLRKKFIIIPQATFRQRIEYIERDVLSIIKKIPYSPKKKLINTGDVCIKPSVYWADFENIKKELLPLIKKYGCMPASKQFKKEKKSGLLAAMYKYHGSPFEVAQLLNLYIHSTPKGHYTRNRVISEYKALCLLHKKYLSQKELYAINQRPLSYAMYNFGGAIKIREACDLGYPLRNASKISRYDQKKAVLEYKRLCKRYKRFLTQQELKDKGYITLERFMRRNKMSIYRVREKTGLNYISSHMQKGFYNVPKAVELYKKICIEHGYFLTQREALTKMDRKLLGFIDRGIGFNKLRALTKLKFILNRKPWTSQKGKNR